MDVESPSIKPIVMDKVEVVVAKDLGEDGEIYLHATIVGSLVTLALSVISHEGWEEICIHCLHSYQIE